MTEEVSLVFHENDHSFAQHLCDDLIKKNYVVFAGPGKLVGANGYSAVRHHTQISNAANIVLMSKHLFRENRVYVKIFAEAVEREWDNIQIVSMDSEWTAIQGSEVEALKSNSFRPMPSDGWSEAHSNDLATRLQKSIESRADSISHFNREAIRQLLTGLFGSNEMIADVNELGGQVSFSICECKHPSSGEIERYISVFPSARLELTSDYLKEHFPDTANRVKSTYVVRSDPRQELSVRQQEITESLFPGKVLRFETMVGRRTLGGGASISLSEDELLISQKWTAVNNPFQPIVTTDDVFGYCMSKMSRYEKRNIIILQGEGGAGKTHFVRFLHDKMLMSAHDVFFLTAHSVKMTEPDFTIGSLYDIYKLSLSSDSQKDPLSRELFDLKFNVEDPTIIVDGLEEIVTMLGDRFHLSEFYADCRQKADRSANGRIIITTRERSWPDEIESYAAQYMLHLFDDTQAESYFNAFFKGKPDWANISYSVYKSMTAEQGDAPPLLCKLIAMEMDGNGSLAEYQSRLDSGEFASTQGLEEILGGFIERERKLGVEWPIQSTFAALGELAVESVTGPVDLETACEVLEKAFNGKRPQNLKAAVRNFILLRYFPETDSVTFRFDFVKTVCLATHIVRSISNIDMDIFTRNSGIALFTRMLTPGSDVSRKIISSGLRGLPSNFFEILSQIIEDLVHGKQAIGSDHETRQVVSNLFFLRLQTDPSATNIQDYTRILKEVFGHDNAPELLSSVSMMRFDQDQHNQLRFDLRGMELTLGNFEDVSIDSMFVADESTTFSNCKFARVLGEFQQRKSGLWRASFQGNCKLGPNFEAALFENSDKAETTTALAIDAIERFFKLFALQNGHGYSKIRTLDALRGAFNSVLGLGADELVDVFKEFNLIEDVPDRRSQSYRLTQPGRISARDLILDSIKSNTIKTVAEKLK